MKLAELMLVVDVPLIMRPWQFEYGALVGGCCCRLMVAVVDIFQD